MGADTICVPLNWNGFENDEYCHGECIPSIGMDEQYNDDMLPFECLLLRMRFTSSAFTGKHHNDENISHKSYMNIEYVVN